MKVRYSRKAGGWVVFEIRTNPLMNRIVEVPISRAFDTEDEAVAEMHTIYDLREMLK